MLKVSTAKKMSAAASNVVQRQASLPTLAECMAQLSSKTLPFDPKTPVPAGSVNVVMFANVDATIISALLNASAGSLDLTTIQQVLVDHPSVRVAVYVADPAATWLGTAYVSVDGGVDGGGIAALAPKMLMTDADVLAQMTLDFSELYVPPSVWQFWKLGGCVMMTTVAMTFEDIVAILKGGDITLVPTSALNWSCTALVSPVLVLMVVGFVALIILAIVYVVVYRTLLRQRQRPQFQPISPLPAARPAGL